MGNSANKRFRTAIVYLVPREGKARNKMPSNVEVLGNCIGKSSFTHAGYSVEPEYTLRMRVIILSSVNKAPTKGSSSYLEISRLREIISCIPNLIKRQSI
jgi:hypothetical protein